MKYIIEPQVSIGSFKLGITTLEEVLDEYGKPDYDNIIVCYDK
jgi:hypothetical protein